MSHLGKGSAGAFDHGTFEAYLVSRRLPEADIDQLAKRLASAVAQLDPALRLQIAQRVVAYTRDLLVGPLSPAGGRILDDASTRLRFLGTHELSPPANDELSA